MFKKLFRKKPTEKPFVSNFFSFSGVLPLALPVALAAFGSVAVIFLLLDQFKNELVWPFGLLAAATAFYLTARYSWQLQRPGSVKEQRICDVVAIVFVLAWFGFNFVFTSQHILTNRDPAIYGVAGAWLINHDNLRIETPPPFGDVPGVSVFSAGFSPANPQTEEVHAQGQHLLPALLGLGGRIFGPQFMLHMNVIFGATALLAIYAFARMLTRPRWALVAVGVVAVSLPLLYFSRDTYTEPLAATFTFGSLALLWAAQSTKKGWLWLLAGLVAGASALTRIDAYLAIAGFVAFLVIFVALSKKGERLASAKNAGLMIGGMSLGAVLGWLDVSMLSTPYYRDVTKLMNQEFLAIAGILTAGLVVTAICWKTNILKWLDAKTKSWRGPAAAALILIIGLVLMSRPLWFESYYPAEKQNMLIAGIQAASGDPIEPRNYAERTVEWVSWYIGPFMAILGGIGLAVAAARAMYQRNLLLLASLAAILGTAIFYFISPQISSDQIWAARRYLPVIMPGLAVFAAIALDELSKKFIDGRKFSKIFTVSLAAAVIIPPMLVAWPFSSHREMTQLALIEKTCQTLPSNAAVLWVGEANRVLIQPTQAFCDKPARGYYSKQQPELTAATLKEVAQNAINNGKTPVIGLYEGDVRLLPGASLANFDYVNAGFYEIERTIHTPPRQIKTITSSLLLAELMPDGSVKRLIN